MQKIGTFCCLISCAIGVFIGISGSITFGILGNYEVILWGLTAAVLALYAFHINYIYYKDKMEEWYSWQSLSAIRYGSLFLFTMNLMVCVIYGFRIPPHHEMDFFPIKDSLVIPLIWCAMNLKWIIVLFVSSSKYMNLFEHEEDPPLLEVIPPGVVVF